ncbi:uncharacterized protein LOC127286146 [Leptopilina boulardi]|uniref:uncharacterized protein LOC127286146 n=1 Tax=Leptopilina boulardi TaxID=63433 RepID=UPI0021F67565|nr:uncharacterized protein LOC127286146 [Leptopilina boulardi]
MRLLSPSIHSDKTKSICYIPHHAVWRNADGQNKVRVVFNASDRTSSGIKLNQIFYTGPKLQNNLSTVLMRWRLHRVVFSADIEMMYRQILVEERDIDLQRIVWQQPGLEDVDHFQLLTLTYGTSCAPYLAIRTLHQLAADEGQKYPKAAKVIRDNIYVDDIFTGDNDELSAIQLRDELISLLKSAGMHLKKWVTNCPSLLSNLPEDDCLRPTWLHFKTENPITALGIAWDPIHDEFRFREPIIDQRNVPTKRRVLAAISKLFDPDGWLSPVIIVTKILMQELWKAKIDWDTPLSNPLLKKWSSIQSSLFEIKNIRLPRWIRLRPGDEAEIHGFGDASKHAFASAIYIRVTTPEGKHHSQLLTAKTRVAPVKTITIPRLELCAAQLTVKLLNHVLTELEISIKAAYAWSDSLNALSWIKADDPSRWPVYVANRVSYIQRNLPKASWRYTPGKDNPADIASRGVDARSLIDSNLWWQGPDWLSKDSTTWPTFPKSQIKLSKETITPSTSLQILLLHQDNAIITRFSSLTRLLRVIARCLRFQLLLKPTLERTELLRLRLTSDEINQAFLACVYLSQNCSFEKELESLRKGNRPRQSPLLPLNPFIDQKGILRVGGRLTNSSLPYDHRHPVILHGNSPLAELIIQWAHKTALHGGFQLTYSLTVKRAWIIRGRVRVKAHIRKCVTCARQRAQRSEQLMGNLPSERVTASYPFEKLGVDYTGPFPIKRTTGRGARTTKGYVALFVCLSSKAVHLEVVGDLTTQSFLGALQRLIGRRGTPCEIWSDNATTFHGADAELRWMLRDANVDWNVVEDTLANRGIKWKFIPPSAPHFGGLWEANIKTAKSHLKKTIGTRPLTYEELSTLVVEIEACMNSRPLLPITGDPEDIDALTPNHALLGRALYSFPEALTINENLDYITRWRLVKALRDTFWNRWSRDYIHTLQQRNKWAVKKQNLQTNDLVLILDSSLLKRGSWPLGRIIKVFPGSDGLVRSASIRTASGIYTRPIAKLCLLPTTM